MLTFSSIHRKTAAGKPSEPETSYGKAERRMRDINDMQVFVEVAKLGSLSAAGRKLGLATSVVSERIASLEARFGVKLIVRTTRRQSLTDAGRTWLAHCESLLADFLKAQQAVQRYRDTPQGVLRVTAPTPLGRRCIAPLIGAFAACHPDIRISLLLDDRMSDIVAEGFDVAIRGGPVRDTSLVGRVIATSRRVVVASQAYLERNGAPATPGDLRNHVCIVHNPDANLSATWRFGRGDVTQVIRIEGALTSNNSELPVLWARAGVGLTQKSWWEVAAEVERGELTTVLDAFEPEPISFLALHPVQRSQSKKVELFIDFLVDSFSSELSSM